MIEDAPERARNQKRRLGGRARTDLVGHAVLLVDDDFCQSRDTRQALQHAGARVLGPYADAESALRSAAASEPSCAIVSVPSADGARIELAATLRSQGVPIIILTTPEAGAIPAELAQAPIVRRPVDYRYMLGVAAQILRKRFT